MPSKFLGISNTVHLKLQQIRNNIGAASERGASMYPATWRKNLLTYSALLGAIIFLCSLAGSSATLAQGNPPYISDVRIFDTSFPLPNAAGLAFSPQANAFLLLADHSTPQPGGEPANLLMITHFEDLVGSADLPPMASPINMAYDSQANQLLLLDTATNELVAIQAGPTGPDPAAITRFPAAPLSLQTPQGMATDPTSGRLFILDSATSQIVRVEPGPQHSFDPSVALAEGRISRVDLGQLGLGPLRGLAFNPTNGHLYFLSPAELKLYEITQAGELVTSRELANLDLALRDPQGIVFAPSSDMTDDPAQMNLFLVDSGRGSTAAEAYPLHSPMITTQGPEAASPSEQSTASGAPIQDSAAEQRPGRIIEFSLTPPVQIPPSISAMAVSSLVRTIDTSHWSPPSPDPSGLTYLTARNRLLICDGEVEETVDGITHFHGVNVWEVTLSGGVVRTANISKVGSTRVPMTNEPTGVTWNPANGHYFFTDDGARRVYDLNPGTDGRVGTGDDTWTYFNTLAGGSGDPEGIAFDTWRNYLFVADGNNREVYQFTLTGSLVNHFDVLAYGVEDPETVEFNPDDGTLFVMSSERSHPRIIQTTISGTLLQRIDISATHAEAAAGLAYAPASDGSGTKHFYIVDRGIDNDTDPTIIDGKIYEVTAPFSTPVNHAPGVNVGPGQSITLPDSATLNGTVSDDGLPNPPGTVTITWSQVSGPGVVNFADTSSVDTTASFSAAGRYILRLTADDGALTDSDEVTILVSEPGTSALEVQVAATSDDAEEQDSGVVQLYSSDLELVFDRSNQKVGIRFNGITVPPRNIVNNAYIQFQVDEAGSTMTSLAIQAEDIDNAPTFTSSSANISSRSTTTASVSWSPPPWTTPGQAGPDQRTPNIASVVQEIVNRPGWASGNSLVIIITGSGKRTGKSFDGDRAGAPLLHVEYNTGPPNNPPLATDDSAGTSEDTPVTIDVAANDSDPDGNLDPTSVTVTSDLEHAAAASNGDGSITYTPSPGFAGLDTFVYEICDSGRLCDTASVAVTVGPSASVIEVQHIYLPMIWSLAPDNASSSGSDKN
jgi:uncharacterized protein YjiK